MTEAEKNHDLAIEFANKYGPTFKGPVEACHFGFLSGLEARPKLTDEEREKVRIVKEAVIEGDSGADRVCRHLLAIIDRLTTTEYGVRE